MPDARSIKEWLILQHLAEEGPGLSANCLKRMGERFRIIRPDLGEEVPGNPCFFKGIVVMGGPMNVDETFQYSFLARERELLRKAVTWEVPVIGICLGAQMLARACGAKVYQGPAPEIGFGPIDLTSDGRNDPLFAKLPSTFQAFHWHGDTFDLPKGAVLLASNSRYQNQAFRIGRYVYGFQFHLEITGELLGRWTPLLVSQGEATERQGTEWKNSTSVQEVMRVGQIVLHRFIRIATSKSQDLMSFPP